MDDDRSVTTSSSWWKSCSRRFGAGSPRLALTVTVGVAFGVLGPAGCIRDTDCGVCDPDNLILESLGGTNYAGRKVRLLNPSCDGPNCPAPLERGSFFVDDVYPCETTEDAQAATDPEEFCKISPLVTSFGLEFVFNNLLEATTIELTRLRPDNPQLFEVYDWKPDIVRLTGPITRFNGDYVSGDSGEPDRITRFVNLSCVGQEDGISAEDLVDPATNPCNRMRGERPAKMEREAEIKSYRGERTAFGRSCSSSVEPPDRCCSTCDWLLSTRIARYGLSGADTPVEGDALDRRVELPWALEDELNPNVGTAIGCTPDGDLPDGFVADKLRTCADFIMAVDRRDEELDWFYRWDCDPGADDDELRDDADPCFVHKLPWYDLMRETHPDDRPTADDVASGRYSRSEQLISACASSSDCETIHDLPGTECIGTHDDGRACLMDASIYAADGDEAGACSRGYCRPAWFVDCRIDAETTGGDDGYCADARFSSVSTAACRQGDEPFDALCDDNGQNCAGTTGRNERLLSFCDGNDNGRITAGECCQDDLGGPAYPDTCDPFYQAEVSTVPRYRRDENLPTQARECVCQPIEDMSDTERRDCLRSVQTGCYRTGEDGDEEYITERHGQYAVKFVSRLGGVIYDPAVKGFEWRPADVGSVPRASIEECAEASPARQVDGRNRHDGWRANDATGSETREDFDRAMCSGQTYTVEFAVPDDGPHLEDKAGNTLSGKATYTFETPQFHVVPGSGSPQAPTDIGPCDDFSLRFSNKYDLSPENLRKLEIVAIDEIGGDPYHPDSDCDDDTPIAGGPECAPTPEDRTDDPCRPPCLQVDIANHGIGQINVRIDNTQFGGDVLRPGLSYRLQVPSAGSFDDVVDDPDLYRSVFWDACGMPLVREGADPYDYDFTIEPPSCTQDIDADGFPLSCDNAPRNANPDQSDIDRDGVGDVIDLCVLVESNANNSADSDNDGVGNECDSCRQTPTRYNDNADEIALDVSMMVRNIPMQTDTDRDGIGDVCDNCILTANCQSYDGSNPYGVGDPIAFDDPTLCQRDDDANMIGDACDGGQMLQDFAAGPIGFGPDDDFDQDGIANNRDACPRQPLTDTIPCDDETDCPPDRSCERYPDDSGGICNHVDSDEDTVGDICDTCRLVSNTMQVFDGEMQEDDQDGDFVGRACEASPTCADFEQNALPYGFFPVSAQGLCCTVELEEQADGTLLRTRSGTILTALYPDDPTQTMPVRIDCDDDDEEANRCRALPPQVRGRIGVLDLPPGCEEAFAAHPTIQDARANRAAGITDENVGDLDEAWSMMCFLPQVDQDFDGYGDPCDLCPQDFDPENTFYTDASGQVIDTAGAYCSGDFRLSLRCPEEMGSSSGSDTGDPTDPMGGTDG